MNILSKSLLSIAVSTALIISAGCSSSDDDTNAPGSTTTGDGTGSTTGATAGTTTDGITGTTVGNTGGTTETDGPTNDPTSDGEGTMTGEGEDNGTGMPPTVVGDLDLSASYPELLRALAGLQLETLADEALLVVNSISAGSSEGIPADAGSFTVTDRGESITVQNEGTTFNCESGGTLTIELGRLDISDTNYSRLVELNQYQFDQCQLSGGAELLNGSASSFFDFASGSRFTNESNRATFTDFSWNQADGSVISADGNTMATDFESTDSNLSRTTTINQYSSTNNNQIIQQIDNGQFDEAIAIVSSGGFQTYSLNINGNVTNESGTPVAITSQPALSRVFVAPGIQSGTIAREPFTGEIDMSAEDGSQVVVTATEPGDASVRQVDVFFRAEDGTTTTMPAQNFVTFEAPVL
ncbi:hypothetical protein OAM69_03525 [bacterium]|nr:hypothetical protein [bacterium]